MEQTFFEELLAIMAAATAITILLNRFQLPSIIAYLIAGILIGPELLNWVDEPDDFTFIAEFGVVFLLFSLGLEFSLQKLIKLRAVVFGLGALQVTISAAVFVLLVWLWGTTLSAAILIAGALALSSTAIVTKELSAIRQVHSRHGQLSIGVLLFQDLAAVVFLMLVPVLAGGSEDSIAVTLGIVLLKALLLFAVLLSVGKWLLPPLHREIARARSEEIFVLSTLVIVLLASWATHQLHLSMALGGFIIGMMLGESPFRHQINADIRPFKDVLLGLFFVTIGMGIDIDIFLEFWPRILLFTFALILFKAAIIIVLVKLGGNTKRMAVQTGLNLAQAGEFGLALLAMAIVHNILPVDQASFIMMIAVLSMAASPFLIRHGDKLYNLLSRSGKTSATVAPDTEINAPAGGHVIIGGYGRVGRTTARLLEANGIEYIAIENDVDVVNAYRQQDINIVFGDCTQQSILESCHLSSARMAVLTFRSIELAEHSIEHIRANGIDVPIILRCAEHGDFDELISLGADHVIPEMLEASLVIGAQVLSILNIEEHVIDEQITTERRAQMRSGSNRV